MREKNYVYSVERCMCNITFIVYFENQSSRLICSHCEWCLLCFSQFVWKHKMFSLSLKRCKKCKMNFVQVKFTWLCSICTIFTSQLMYWNLVYLWINNFSKYMYYPGEKNWKQSQIYLAFKHLLPVTCWKSRFYHKIHVEYAIALIFHDLSWTSFTFIKFWFIPKTWSFW